MEWRWAVLIDAENVRAEVADPLFEQVATWGDACVRRMFADFDGNHLGWKAAAKRHSIEPVHLPDMVPGKNGADIALVIDAVDLMHSGHVDGFCLVSSDSDFTRLAWRLRAEGKIVRGVGNGTAVLAFREACSAFIPVEEMTKAGSISVKKVTPATTPCQNGLDPKSAVPLLEQALASLGAAEWHGIGGVGSALKALHPNSDLTPIPDAENS